MVGTCVVATIGYRMAGWSWIDAIYMVTITIYGVGFGEVRPIDTAGMKLFTVGFIIAGCTSLIYVIGGFVQWLTEGELIAMLGQRQTQRDVDAMEDHTIICGYGRVGRTLAETLARQSHPIVVLDSDPIRVELARSDGFLAALGSGVDDDTLVRVGLHRANTLATVLPDDATNVFITLTARDLDQNIRIIARAESHPTERKLYRSGASHVVLPTLIGAQRIAELSLCDQEEADSLSSDRLRMLHQRQAVHTSVPAGGRNPSDATELESGMLQTLGSMQSELRDHAQGDMSANRNKAV